MLIRNYTEKDRSACLRIFLSNIPKYFRESEIKDFETFLDGDISSYLVAEINEHVLGCGGYYVRDGTGRLTYGMVRQDVHHQGIGSALVTARLDRLFNTIGVEVVAIDTSQHSFRFFEKFGFVTGKIVENDFGNGLHRYSMSLKKEDFIQPELKH